MNSSIRSAPAVLAAFLLVSFTAPGSNSVRALGAHVDHTRVHYDDSQTGVVWARGKSYKARFDADGSVYIPCFGSDAPRNFPVAFRIESISSGEQPLAFDARAAPARRRDTIVYDRGVVVETWGLAPESVEQSFTFASRPGAGDLVVRIGLESELVARRNAENIELANTLGAVRYGRATALDASGDAIGVETLLDAGSIELRVPEAFLAHARFPVTIDPLVSTFPLSTTSANHTQPDVAYSVGSDRYLVVFEEDVSATDHDVYADLLDASGNSVNGGYVDLTSAFWANPSTATHRTSDQFLVVAQVGLPAGGGRTIRGRTLSASTFVMGAAFTINGAEGGDKFNPDVGGDPDFFASTATYYCVVWERALSATNHDIHARLVTSTGTLFGAGTILVDNSSGTLDTDPAISESDGKSAGGLKNWNLVWERLVSPSDHDIHGAQISWQGAISTPSFAVVVDPTSDDTHPDASSPIDNAPGGASLPRFYLVVNERDTATSHFNMGWLMLENLLHDQKNLTVLDGGVSFTDTVHPAADSDGDCFVVTYSELQSPSTTNFDVFASTFAPIGTHLAVSEGHVPLATSPTPENHTDVVAQASGGGSGPRFMAVWDDASGGATLGDIEGALYDCGPFTLFCRPGSNGVIPCPCGNPAAPGIAMRGCDNSSSTGGAVLVAIGNASVSADTVLLSASGEKPTALSVFTQGATLAPAGIVFGQGVRCVGGTLKRLYIKPASGGTASAPTGGDPSINARSAALGDPIGPGTMRYYFVYYRDATVLGGCPPTSTFNVTNAVQTAWNL